ncbi:MAG: hypothetical protein P4M11_10830 [Candidatus Pacebacteria bacterium]|nr:hypothetical protein [Candidatus Paceibacterota bacterium]
MKLLLGTQLRLLIIANPLVGGLLLGEIRDLPLGTISQTALFLVSDRVTG